MGFTPYRPPKNPSAKRIGVGDLPQRGPERRACRWVDKKYGIDWGITWGTGFALLEGTGDADIRAERPVPMRGTSAAV